MDFESTHAALRLRMGDSASWRDARPGGDLRQRSADSRDGPQGLRAGGQCRDAAGIVQASYAMPDAHWGYGFPIGGVAAFDPEAGGVVSAGGVGFDISCGVRCLHTGLVRDDIVSVQRAARRTRSFSASRPAWAAPARSGSTIEEMDEMLAGGAQWAVERGWGTARTSSASRSAGRCSTPNRAACQQQAKKRQRDEMGTLGSGNHYLEVQEVTAVFDAAIAEAFGLEQGDIVVMIHCGSRGLGHQIGTEFLKRMAIACRAIRHRAARSRARLRADQVRRGPGVSGRDARSDQLRAGESPDPHRTSCARYLPRSCRKRSCRCSTTSRTTPARSRSIAVDGGSRAALRASQGRDACVRPGASRYPGAAA